MPIIEHEFNFNMELISVFKSNICEKFVLEIMNDSEKIFPHKYKYVEEQSCGQCDFTDETNGEKFDAKLPFETWQINLLTDGKKHKPYVNAWLKEMQQEASDFNPVDIRDGKTNVSDTKLYKIMKKRIAKDKDDESIIFFFPFPIVLSCPELLFVEFATDYLKAIFEKLLSEFDFSNRSIYAVYPSAVKSVYAVRDAKRPHVTEYIENTSLDNYFTHEIVIYKTKNRFEGMNR